MDEKLKKRLLTTFKLHGFSLRRFVILTDKTISVILGFSNCMEMKCTKQYECFKFRVVSLCMHNFGYDVLWKEATTNVKVLVKGQKNANDEISVYNTGLLCFVQ